MKIGTISALSLLLSLSPGPGFSLGGITSWVFMFQLLEEELERDGTGAKEGCALKKARDICYQAAWLQGERSSPAIVCPAGCSALSPVPGASSHAGANMGPPTAFCSPAAAWGHRDKPSSNGRSLAGKAEPGMPLHGAGLILLGALTCQTGCDSPPWLSGTRSQAAQFLAPREPVVLEGQSRGSPGAACAPREP